MTCWKNVQTLHSIPQRRSTPSGLGWFFADRQHSYSYLIVADKFKVRMRMDKYFQGDTFPAIWVGTRVDVVPRVYDFDRVVVGNISERVEEMCAEVGIDVARFKFCKPHSVRRPCSPVAHDGAPFDQSFLCEVFEKSSTITNSPQVIKKNGTLRWYLTDRVNEDQRLNQQRQRCRGQRGCHFKRGRHRKKKILARQMNSADESKQLLVMVAFE